MITTKQRGDHAEQQALQHLQSFGLELIEQNFHSRGGEIDLIMSDQECLIFVEVRYRKTDKYGSAAESVNSQANPYHPCCRSLLTKKHNPLSELSL